MTHFNLAMGSPLQSSTIQYPQSLTHAEGFYGYRDCSSRKSAIEEGYLVDVSTLSRTFKADVSITREVWELYITGKNHDQFKQKVRAISLLTQAKIAIKHARPQATEVFFEVKRFPRKSRTYLNKIRLWVVVSPGDHKEPVLTIMLDTQHETLS